uniref:Protein kinase domain-containing protein n=1 Tax=Arcella intermedia TaxID=1963864 RepID=A0A6B2L4X1_9EUKA
MEFGKYLLCDLSKWIIQADEIEFLSEIGQGTSATVYKGKYESQTVAIKVVNLEEKNADKQLNDLKMEFEVMTAFLNLHFSHQDYFVKLFGIVSTPRLCLVMQYCGRGSLFHLLHKPDFELTWPLLFCWMKEITSGIHALHSLKPPIVHRDIKTLNLLVTDNFEIRIADFGLSRFLRRTNSGNYATLTKLRGTYCYSAPELYKGTPYTTKSDVYSLSIVLWELATKCVTGIYTQPYSEFSFINFDFQIIIQVAKKGIRPSIAPTIPSEVSDIIKLLWSDDPEQRPDTEILLEMLESAENKYKKENLEWDALRQSESHSIPVTQSVPSVPVLNFEHISSSGNISGPSTPTTSSLPVSPFLKMSDTTISKKETKFNHLSKKLESHFPSTPKPKHTRTHPTLSLSATTSPMQKRKFS